MLVKRLLPYAVIFITIESLLRLSLLARALLDVEFHFAELANVLARGLWFDTVTASFFLLPIAFYHLIFPTRKHGTKSDMLVDKIFRFIFTFILLFDAVAEHLFWSEFTTRFNFIAVDYLIYTQEVMGNIVESYPLHWLFLGIGICTLFISWLSLRIFPLSMPRPSAFKERFAKFSWVVFSCIALYFASSIEQANIKDNAEASELAANGIYNLFSAFWNNEISYGKFYAVRPDMDILSNARNLLWEQEHQFVNDDGRDLTRIIQSKGPELRKNVILVVMESMSADYMGIFGNKQGLTPNLDRLTEEGFSFSELYATGTRTVRGLEALVLSIPPTPGQSIIRRPENENLFSLGFIFKDRGYDTRFIYGGYGYFDNMNQFFAGNGFDVIDRTSMSKEEVNFANVWGVCDEDLFNKALADADKSYANGKPFMQLLMTTSNHRPFTYPDGRIDISSRSGRLGGVKYADYSVGKLVEEAKKKPWFKNTIFVFVADHTAGAGGKAELDPRKYHIPMIFYAPDFIKPGKYEKIASQIDMAPVLLSFLNFSYYTKFFGEDVINDADETPHAFISNYQKVALIKNDKLTVLSPKRKIEGYSWPEVESSTEENSNIEDAITYYQYASWWKEQYKRIPTVIKP